MYCEYTGGGVTVRRDIADLCFDVEYDSFEKWSESISDKEFEAATDDEISKHCIYNPNDVAQISKNFSLLFWPSLRYLKDRAFQFVEVAYSENEHRNKYIAKKFLDNAADGYDTFIYDVIEDLCPSFLDAYHNELLPYWTDNNEEEWLDVDFICDESTGDYVLDEITAEHWVSQLLPDAKRQGTYIMNYGTNLYKIGRGNNPEERLKQMRTGCPTLKLLGTLDMDLERAFHNKYKDRRREGEWFEFTASEIDYIIDFYGFKRCC